MNGPLHQKDFTWRALDMRLNNLAVFPVGVGRDDFVVDLLVENERGGPYSSRILFTLSKLEHARECFWRSDPYFVANAFEAWYREELLPHVRHDKFVVRCAPPTTESLGRSEGMLLLAGGLFLCVAAVVLLVVYMSR